MTENIIKKYNQMTRVGKYIENYAIPEILESNPGITEGEIASTLVGSGIAMLCAAGNRNELKKTLLAVQSTVEMFERANKKT